VMARRLVDGDELMQRVFAQRGVYVPTAPSLGLYLDRPLFEIYDQRCHKLREEEQQRERQRAGSTDGTEVLRMQERKTVKEVYEQHHDDIHTFRRVHIYPTICDEESTNLSAYRWLASVSLDPSLWPSSTDATTRSDAANQPQDALQQSQQALVTEVK